MPPENDTPASSGEDTGTVAGMLDALVSRGGPNVQAMYDGLTGMAYIPGIPDIRAGGHRQRYLGWADPARPAADRTRLTLYLEAHIVCFGRATDRRTVGRLLGADTSPAPTWHSGSPNPTASPTR